MSTLGGSAGQNDSGAMTPTYVAAGIVLVGLIIYWFFYDEIVHAVFLIRRVEIMLIMLWNPKYTLLMNWCNHVLENSVSMKQLVYLTYNIAAVLTKIYWFVGVVMVVFIFFRHPNCRFRRRFSMLSLSLRMKKYFKSVSLPSSVDGGKCVKQFDQAKSPIEYLQANCLVDKNEINQLKLYHKLIEQMGPQWTLHEKLSSEVYGLFSAFISYIADHLRRGEQILISLTRHHEQLDIFSKKINSWRLKKLIDQSISQCIEHKDVQSAMSNHCYVSTLLVELLTSARLGGSISSSNFLW